MILVAFYLFILGLTLLSLAKPRKLPFQRVLLINMLAAVACLVWAALTGNFYAKAIP